ncbi:hypothetical protein Hanom_Chr15g01367171 [Helianthus anomalus]
MKFVGTIKTPKENPHDLHLSTKNTLKPNHITSPVISLEIERDIMGQSYPKASRQQHERCPT